MQRLAVNVGDRANAAKIYVATQIIVDVVIHTPVDTSKALSNWQAGLSGKNENRLLPHVAGSHGSTQGASIGATIAAAVQTLREARPGQTIHIFNNLPYIRKLNDGSSQQQPAGFVERAALVGRKALRNVRF